ncbi:MAG: cation:proton antiporter [Gemmatimonadetes bacterium]|nr:cation:proton antiporter [Gemmatimonadota bacterium]
MTEVFTAASHHDILVLVVQLAVLLFSARALGEVAQRLGHPAVVGELLAGIVLGPSLLAGSVPFLAEWIVPQTQVQGYLLELVSMIGVMFLLVITGLETDLALIRRHARAALSVSWGGIVVTFSTGFLLGWYLPDFLLVDADRRLVFALFVATAMSISAIPVIAKVLLDMNLIRRDIGQTILAAGMSDDTIGWIMLGIVAGLARTGEVSALEVGRTVGSVLVFMVLAFTVGRWVVRRSLNYVQDEVVSRFGLLTLVVVFTFAFGAITQALNLEPVLGAFVIGILFGQMHRLPENVHTALESVALGIFAPIFFAVAGLKVDLRALLDPTLGAIALAVIVIATVGKVAGTYAGARLFGRKDHWTALSYGAGLNARGALEIIIATVGLQVGILTQDMFSIIVVMAMATSLMAPFALRFVLRRVVPGQEEKERLEREEIAAGTLVDSVRRVLLPVRVRPREHGSVQTIEARLLKLLGRDAGPSITLLTAIREEAAREPARAYLAELKEMFGGSEVAMKVVESTRPGDAILDEAGKDYHLIVLGAPEALGDTDAVFNPLIDFVVRMAPCPTMVIRGSAVGEDWRPRRILVPTNGSLAARRAAEVAFAIAAGQDDGVVEVLTVPLQHRGAHHADPTGRLRERGLQVARQIVDGLEELGRSMGVRSVAAVREGQDPETVILQEVEKRGHDLLVIGSDVRPGSERLHLGPRVERILFEATCPVLILNSSR